MLEVSWYAQLDSNVADNHSRLPPLQQPTGLPSRGARGSAAIRWLESRAKASK